MSSRSVNQPTDGAPEASVPLLADAHVHLFARGYKPGPEPINEPDEYRALCGRHRVQRSLLVGYEGSARHAGNSEYGLMIAKRWQMLSALRYLGCGERPSRADVESDRQRGFRGYSLYLQSDREPDSSWATALWADDGPPGLISVNALPEALDAWNTTLVRSGAIILVSHLGLPGTVVSNAAPSTVRKRLAPLLRLADEPSVFVKLSGLYAIDPVYPHEGARAALEEILSVFGTDRLVWGSDFSAIRHDRPGTPPFTMEDWTLKLFTQDESRRVHRDNLIEILDQVA